MLCLNINQIRKYDKVLSGERLKEFTRASGLAANGVGIGSFVYLRRIFEELIGEAHKAAKNDAGYLLKDFSLKMVSQKIGLILKHEAHISNMKIKLKAKDTHELIKLLKVTEL